MGYNSCFLLVASPVTKNLYMEIDEELGLYDCRFECEGIDDGVGCWLDIENTWYNCKADMVRVSQSYPEVKFTLYVEGESHDDTWRAHFHNGRIQVNNAMIFYPPFIPSKMQDGIDDTPQEYEDLARKERITAIETAVYHCIREVLGKQEKDFPWDPQLMKEAEDACRDFLESHGFAVPKIE